MPAVSKKQAVAMNIAKAVQQGQATAKPGSPSAQIAGSMAPTDVNEFAGTPQGGLPDVAVKAHTRKPPVVQPSMPEPQVVSKGITKMPFKK